MKLICSSTIPQTNAGHLHPQPLQYVLGFDSSCACAPARIYSSLYVA